MHAAWAAALGIRPDDFPKLLHAIALVVALPEEIESEISRVDPEEFDRDSVMRWYGNAVSFLAPNLFQGHQAVQVVSQIEDTWLGSLESCSFVLHKHRRQLVITETDLDHIRSLIAELVEATEKELPFEHELRDFLTDHIDAMLRALDEIQIVGAPALEDSFDRAIGAVERRSGEFAVKGYTRREAWKKFGAVLAGTLLVLQIPQTAMELPSEIRGAIESPPPPAVERVVINETIVEEMPPQDHAPQSGGVSPATGVERATASP